MSMQTETEHDEKVLAFAWHCGTYPEEQDKYSAELRSLNFVNVILERSRLLEINNNEY